MTMTDRAFLGGQNDPSVLTLKVDIKGFLKDFAASQQVEGRTLNDWVDDQIGRCRVGNYFVSAADAAEIARGAAIKVMLDKVGLIQNLVNECHGASRDAGWYTDPLTGAEKPRNLGELISLMHSELSEALEGCRKDKMDDHLPHRKSVEVEIADLIIRAFDFAGYLGLDLGGAYVEKRAYNAVRADHKIENRMKADGKKF